MKTIVIKIGGMTCPACSGGLEKSLNRRDGIAKAFVNLMLNNATITYDDTKISLSDIEVFVEKAGFRSLGIDDYQLQINKEKSQRPKIVALGVIGVALLCLSLFGDGIKSSMPIFYAIISTLLGILAVYCGRDILRLGVFSPYLFQPLKQVCAICPPTLSLCSTDAPLTMLARCSRLRM